jgi:hypothetical protein
MATPDTARRVRRWLEAEGLRVQEMVAAAGVALNLSVTDLSGKPYNVIWREESRGRILLGAAPTLSDEQQRKFAAVPESRQTEFLGDLRRTLLTMGLGHFEGVGLPLQRIVLYVPVYEDGMDQDRFMWRFALLQRALILVIDMINRELELRPAWE